MFWLYIYTHLILYDLMNTTGMTLLKCSRKVSTRMYSIPMWCLCGFKQLQKGCTFRGITLSHLSFKAKLNQVIVSPLMDQQWCQLQNLWNETQEKLTASDRLHYWQHLICFQLWTCCVTTPCKHSTVRKRVIIWNYDIDVLTNGYLNLRNLLFVNIA